MANETVFNQRADYYDRARPGHAPEAVQAIMGWVKAEAKAVDIGAGTGIFTRELLRHGIETYAVEPNAQMRAKLEKKPGDRIQAAYRGCFCRRDGAACGFF